MENDQKEKEVKTVGPDLGENLGKTHVEIKEVPKDEELKRLEIELKKEELKETKQNKKEKATLSRLRELMGKGQDGYMVSIDRKRPGYAKGMMEEYEYDPEDPVTWRDIEEDCGGGYFKVTLNNEDGQWVGYCYITIYGPPKKDGVIIPDPNAVNQAKEDTDRMNMMAMAEMIKQMMNPIVKQQQDLMGIIAENSRKEPVPVQQGMDMSQMTGMMKMFRSVMDMAQDLIPESGGGADIIDPENPMMNLLAPLVTKLLEGKRPSQAFQQPPPQQPPPPPAPPPPVAPPQGPLRISNEQLLSLMAERFRGPAGQKALMDILSKGGTPPPPPGGVDYPGLEPDPPAPPNPVPPVIPKKPKSSQGSKKTPIKSKAVKKKAGGK